MLASDGGSKSVTVVPMLIATFSLMPHHSKVAAQFDVLFALPDVIVDWLQVTRRAMNPLGTALLNRDLNASADAPDRLGNRIVLTAEDQGT